ncbi:histidinol-phosphatase [Corynebacterium phoceense]|nr:histidinol-phosphatase [Corynebacterium phoceense]MCQ9349222.1 histidinol-phosphatase [Corynebacterium phoceense]
MTESTTYSADLELALQFADAADALTMERFEAENLVVESKPDLTPVSDADIACEKLLRERLAEVRPDDEVLGEEFGGEATFEGRQWVIDPIDGTKNFVRNVPVWATLIALLEDGKPVVGVVSAPALGRRWWAAKGTGAHKRVQVGTLDTTRLIAVSKVTNVADCSISNSSLTGWADRGLRENFIALTDRAWRLHGFGDFFSYCLVAEGAVDVAAEPEVSLWDLAALAILVEEAGGRFTSLNGVDGSHGGDAVATNGLLHDSVVKRIGAEQR